MNSAQTKEAKRHQWSHDIGQTISHPECCKAEREFSSLEEVRHVQYYIRNTNDVVGFLTVYTLCSTSLLTSHLAIGR
jgi:hypothetical protein